MTNETRTLWITYNGEIYNHADLRPALERAGHRYQHALGHRNHPARLRAARRRIALQLFRGMFAFAIWDSRRRRLFCARDRLGIKPFYYYWDGRLFAFASEIKALLEHPAISPALEEELLPEDPGVRLLERRAHAVPRDPQADARPSSRARSWTEPHPQLKIERYWDVPRGRRRRIRTGLWIAETRRRLEESVEMRLMSDVPLGDVSERRRGFKRHRRADEAVRIAEPVKTFAVGYQEPQFSELSYAAEVARADRDGASRNDRRHGRFLHALPRLIWHEDEPIAWPSSVSLYFVSKLAAEHVKVVLTGEGSDEMFARLRALSLASAEPAGRGGLSSRACAVAPLDAVAGRGIAAVRAQRCGASCGTPSWDATTRSSHCSWIISIALFPQDRAGSLALRQPPGHVRELPALLERARRTPRRSRACSTPIRKPTWWNCS